MNREQLINWLVDSIFSLWCSGDLKIPMMDLEDNFNMDDAQIDEMVEKYGPIIEKGLEILEQKAKEIVIEILSKDS